MWRSLGNDSVKVMADGCICLPQLWESAWQEGGGDRTIRDFDPIDETRLERLYQNPSFLPSHTLDTIGSVLGANSLFTARTPMRAALVAKRKTKRTRRIVVSPRHRKPSARAHALNAPDLRNCARRKWAFAETP